MVQDFDGAGYLSVPCRPTYLDNGRTKSGCACSKSGNWGCFNVLYFFILPSFALSLSFSLSSVLIKYILKKP